MQNSELTHLPTCEPSNVTAFKPSNVQTSLSDPVSAYRSLAHLTPNPAQRHMLESKVANLVLWQQTVEHWLTHGWNPMNIAGMLELYARGGPSDCRYCRTDRKPARAAKTAQEYTHKALQDLCCELGIPTPPDET
ncbi:MAG: hypothetical protein WAM09_18000 [Anaerolineales bacterium]